MAASRSTAVVQRFDALDSLRCIAVLLMVQGHVFYLALAAVNRSGPWYRWHDYVHGYTAPGFLFGAGLAFGYTTLIHRIEQHTRWTPELRTRLYRYLSLIAIGYALQLPPLAESAASWQQSDMRKFVRVEALQHIGAVLVFCLLLVILLRGRVLVAVTTLILGVAIAFFGPAVSRIPVEDLGPPLLGAYWTSGMGSTLPLVPWAGFVFMGVAAGALLRQVTGRVPLGIIAAGFAVGGSLLVALSLQLDHQWPGIFGEHRYWKVSPYFFIRRLGWLMFALGALAALDSGLRRMQVQDGAIRLWVRRVSQRSIVVYVAHLILLYGSPFSPGLNLILERRLDWWQSAGVAVLIFSSLGLLLAAWNALEAQHGERFARARRFGLILATLAVIIAVVRAGDRILGQPSLLVARHEVVPATPSLPTAPSPSANELSKETSQETVVELSQAD